MAWHFTSITNWLSLRVEITEYTISFDLLPEYTISFDWATGYSETDPIYRSDASVPLRMLCTDSMVSNRPSYVSNKVYCLFLPLDLYSLRIKEHLLRAVLIAGPYIPLVIISAN